MPKSSYGTNGIANTYVGNSMAVLDGGKIIAADSNFIARYHIDGSNDFSFGYNAQTFPYTNTYEGIQKSPIGIASIAIQKDGKIVVAGFLGNHPRHYFAVARFFWDGKLDYTFSDDGIQVLNLGSGDSYATSVVIANNGKILIGGYTYTENNYDFALVRLNKNGSVDTTFSNAGKVITDFGKDEKANSMVLQTDGKVVLAGSTNIRGEQIALARYNTDGSLDNTFSDDGKQISGISGNDFRGKSVVMQPDGKILVGGSMPSHSNHLFLARYDTDGTLDNTFSKDGILMTDSGEGYSGMAVAIQPDGKILLGGSISDGNDHNFWLARYSNNGSLDNSFGKDGVEITDVSAGNDCITGLAISEKKLFVAGNADRSGAIIRHVFNDNMEFYPNVDVTTPGNTAEEGANIKIEATATDIDGSISKVDFYVEDYYHNKVLIGTATERPYTCVWKDAQLGDYYHITAKATDDKGLATTSESAYYKIQNFPPAPAVSITSPITNTMFPFPAAITISATAEDTGSLVKVDLYDNFRPHETTTKYPYTFALDHLTPGAHSLTAYATNKHSVTGDSKSMVKVFVYEAQSAPSVRMTPPAKSTYMAPASIPLTAIAKELDNGKVKRVDFFNNDTLIGSVSPGAYGSSYTFNWSTVPPGLYSITARAIDNDSMTTTTSPVQISVYDANGAPSVSLTSPLTIKTFTAPALITISANASDKDGSINKVDFYSNDTLIGTATESPYTFSWDNVAAGNYFITAKATDNNLLVTTSDSVRISVVNPKVPPSASITSPVVNKSFTAPASIILSANAEDTDGRITKVDFYSNGNFIGTAAESPYTFTWNNVPAGDYSITAKAIDNDLLVTASDAVRISVNNPRIPPYVSITDPVPGSAFTAPASIHISANAWDTYGSVTKVDFYNGEILIGTVTYPPYAFTWDNVPAGNYSITAKATDNDSEVTTSDPVLVSIDNPRVPPAVSITGPVVYSTFTAPASIIITVHAADTDGSISKVDFYNHDILIGSTTESPYTFTWNDVPAGNYFITAKATDNDLLVTTSDPIPLFVNNPQLPPIVSITSPVLNSTFTTPASIIIAANAEDPDGWIRRVDFYWRDIFIGTATQPPYTFTWYNVPAGDYTITAKAIDNDFHVATSDEVRFSVINPKIPPYVSITSPVPGSSFTAPASITIAANAWDTYGSISKVDFYNGNVLIGTVTDIPYALTWNNVPAGNYSITAKATDNDLQVTTSDPVQVSVNNPKVPPSVSITVPVVNSTFISPASIIVSASAADADGSISKVEFYNNDILIGTVTESPYTFTWNNVPAGNYSITAKATDNDLLVTTSESIKISVVPNKPPTVSITTPLNDESFTSPASIPLRADAADSDGKISKVEFYNGTTLLKTVTDAPYTFAWQNVAAGSYKIVAVATDDYGLKATSSPVTLSVVQKDSVIVKYAPNPATNIINVSTVGFDQNKPLKILVIASGVVLKIIEVNNSSQTIQLDVSSLVSGMYTLKLTCGDKVISKQFLKL